MEEMSNLSRSLEARPTGSVRLAESRESGYGHVFAILRNWLWAGESFATAGASALAESVC